MKPFATTRKVEFADTDMGGVVHFSRYLVYMETAEHRFLASAGVDVAIEHEGHVLSWPRVSVSCEYRKPVRFGDELRIEVGVIRRGRKSMTYGFRFLRGEEEIAVGRSTAVCCRMDGRGGLEGVEIPAELAERLARLPGA